MAHPRPEDLFICFVLDRSGSMDEVREQTIAAFNEFLRAQQADEGRTVMTLVRFDSESVDLVVDALPVREVLPLDARSYEPRAATPLLDAVGRALTWTETRVAEGWGGKVLVVVLTDGLENASREWTLPALFQRIGELRARGWAFVFLGADQDAWASSTALGMSPRSAARWHKSGRGVSYALATSSRGARAWRRGQRAADDLISDEERSDIERPE